MSGHYDKQFEEHHLKEQAKRRKAMIAELNAFIEKAENAELLEVVRLIRELPRIRALLSFLNW